MSKPSSTAVAAAVRPDDYKHSPVHYAVAVGDHATLSRIISSLPRLADPTRIHSERDSLSQEHLADKISAALDRRDNPRRETPLHLAVKCNDHLAAGALAGAGADISLQNSSGWNPLQEALLRRSGAVAETLLQHQHRAAWMKWRRRLPRVVAGLRRMRDFYMEISFHFESSIVPFVGKIAPSDTYRIWKGDGNLRADMSLAGFDGMKVQRADQSFLFFGDGEPSLNIPPGSLLVLNHDDRKIFDAFENAGAPLSDADVAGFCNQTSVHRPGMDVTQAELVGRTNWRRQEKMESVGEWKAKVYDVHNVVFSYRSRKIVPGDTDIAGSEQILPLELEEDAEEGFLVCENPRLSLSSDRRRRHSSFIHEDRITLPASRNSVDVPSIPLPPGPRRRPPLPTAPPPATKEKEYVKSLKPSVWLTEQFPLKTEELLPLLDILANKVKAVRRMRELLTTKFPPGTFPVKLAIPVVPTVRVVITFTKFEELQSTEQFFTPFSSPRHLIDGYGSEEEEPDQTHPSSRKSGRASTSVSSMTWHRWSTRRSSSADKVPLPQQQHHVEAQESDPFAIPMGYSWSSFGEKTRKMKKSKSSYRIMASDAPSWADQWGSGGIGAMGEADDVKTAKEDESKKRSNMAGLGKAKAVAMAGAQKIKGGTTMGINWIKNLSSKKKSAPTKTDR